MFTESVIKILRIFHMATGLSGKLWVPFQRTRFINIMEQKPGTPEPSSEARSHAVLSPGHRGATAREGRGERGERPCRCREGIGAGMEPPARFGSRGKERRWSLPLIPRLGAWRKNARLKRSLAVWTLNESISELFRCLLSTWSGPGSTEAAS